MATLHIRNIPDELYSKIESLAINNNRSINEEVLVLLENAAKQERVYPDQVKLLAEVRRRRYTYAKGKHVMDSVEMLREDRAR